VGPMTLTEVMYWRVSEGEFEPQSPKLLVLAQASLDCVPTYVGIWYWHLGQVRPGSSCPPCSSVTSRYRASLLEFSLQ
jgi:hypothetical protein